MIARERLPVKGSSDNALSLPEPERITDRLRRLANLQHDPIGRLAFRECADLIAALVDRVVYLEAALHHVRDDLDRLNEESALNGQRRQFRGYTAEEIPL